MILSPVWLHLLDHASSFPSSDAAFLTPDSGVVFYPILFSTRAKVGIVGLRIARLPGSAYCEDTRVIISIYLGLPLRKKIQEKGKQDKKVKDNGMKKDERAGGRKGTRGERGMDGGAAGTAGRRNRSWLEVTEFA